MKILITNDDGYRSESILHLAKWATRLGEVTLIAPKSEQSGKSQSIDFCSEIEIKKIDLDPSIRSYYVDSTPADCVRFATAGLCEDFDLLLSGINYGYNLGDDIVYSGTIGAIYEGGRVGIKGIAISTDTPTFETAYANLDYIYDFFCKNNLLERGDLYNVNIPLEVKGIKITRQGGIYFSDRFVHKNGDMYIQEGEPVPTEIPDLGKDIDAMRAGLISVTPLVVSRTDFTAYEKLKNI